MDVLFVVAGGAMMIAGIVCSVIVLIDAFRDEVWKGVLCLLCGFYSLYYIFAEFEHDRKWLVILGAFGGGILGAALMSAGGV